MSRSNYSDECGHMELYRGNVERSIKSRRGQERLRELKEALLALPAKALQADVFVGLAPGEVCALGAWALAHAANTEEAAAMVPRDADDFVMARALEGRGWPKLLVWEAVYINDEANWGEETPEHRYARILAWVEENIVQ
jgi:hypothetical protein